MKTFVMGDPHGALRAIKQVLERASFDYEKDRLIVLGDVADGWPEVAESLEFIITEVKNLVYIRGNHDQWLKEWLKYGRRPDIWTLQGGQNSITSYLNHPQFPDIAKKHLEFFKMTKCYHLDEKNRLFVHGGVDLDKKLEDNTKMYLMWDRDLWEKRHSSDTSRKSIMRFKEIFVGHTSIYRFSHRPIHYNNIWFMDTGGGWEGVLSVMNIDTKEIFQSDVVKDLYPESRGRGVY
ncbi:MAG TPA: metallophosphoesterase [Patescibacteria group bacterium]|nr:metallophosphoesterase [Patescibacteria group bacterium]